jgi:hypothetical protein
MAQKLKSKTLLYIILGLVCILLLSLIIGYFKRKYMTEGIEMNNNKDNFTVSLNITSNTPNGLVDPFPYGTYTLETSSGEYKSSLDFSMNEPTVVKTFYSVDMSNNVADRTITIYPKKTSNTVQPLNNRGDIITNQFTLDISFNEMTYKLKLPAEQILDISPTTKPGSINSSKVIPTPTPSKASFANYIDKNNNLIITGIGIIYDKNKNNVGSVGMDNKDMNNQKTFVITMKNSENINFNLNKIIITFIFPISLLDSIPPPLDDKLLNQIPKLDPNTDYKLSLTQP